MSTVFCCCLCGSPTYKVLYAPRSVVQCRQCGLRSVFPQPASVKYEDSYYDTFSGQAEDLSRMWQKRWDVLLQYAQQGRVLDIGAGTGMFLSLGKERFTVLGTEVSQYAVKRAKDRFHVELTMHPEALPAASFDCITAWHVLEHVQNPLTALRTWQGLLKPGGYLFLAVPNDDSWKQRLKRLLRYKTLYFDATPSREQHLSFFTLETLTQLLEKAGFLVVSVQADDYYGKRSLTSRISFSVSKMFTDIMPLQAASAVIVVARKQ